MSSFSFECAWLKSSFHNNSLSDLINKIADSTQNKTLNQSFNKFLAIISYRLFVTRFYIDSEDKPTNFNFIINNNITIYPQDINMLVTFGLFSQKKFFFVYLSVFFLYVIDYYNNNILFK